MNTRLRVIVIVFGALLVLLTYTFPVWQPFFLRDPQSDTFPGLAAELQPAYQALPAAQRRLYLQMNNQNSLMAQAILTAALSPDESAPPELHPAPDTARLVFEGAFAEIDLEELAIERDEDVETPPFGDLFTATGSFAFYEFQDGRKLLRLEDFRVTNGPNLHVYLSPNPAPLTFAELDFYFDAGQLAGSVGAQNYEIPASLNLAEFASVVIVCVDYQFIYGVARF